MPQIALDKNERNEREASAGFPSIRRGDLSLTTSPRKTSNPSFVWGQFSLEQIDAEAQASTRKKTALLSGRNKPCPWTSSFGDYEYTRRGPAS